MQQEKTLDSLGIISPFEEVHVDFTTDPAQMTIKGDHFSFGNTLTVLLGTSDVPLNPVGVPTDTEIVVELPPNLSAGDYLLTVSTGNGQSQNDEYDLTLLEGTGGGGSEPPTGEIGGTVFVDSNGNGVQDANEPGIPGVIVTLECTLPDGSTLNDSQVTDADGNYLFSDVRADSFCTVNEGQIPG